jgi:uncharacterized protein YaiI (UPF0178 family)
MFILKKKNRVYTTEDTKRKNKLLSQGFDLIDEKGEVKTPATGGKTYTSKQYNDLLAENKKLKGGKSAAIVKEKDEEIAELKKQILELTKEKTE